MKKILFLFIVSISIINSQIVPPSLLNEIDIKKLPSNIPSISNSDTNINFSEHAISNHNIEKSFSYLKIISSINDNYQIKLSDVDLPNDGYIVFWDKTNDCLYGPYRDHDNNIIFPSIMNGNEIIIIYVEDNNTDNNGSFIVESIMPYNNISYETPHLNSVIRKDRDHPTLMVTGYWPPTNEMLRHFSTDALINPNGWEGENWRDLGFDIVAFFPEFDPPDCSNCGQGYGDFEVDYQDTSADFWAIINDVKPSGIITFSRGYNNNSWELENNVYNHASWIADYTSPYYPNPSPPDDSVSPGYNRGSGLPLNLLEQTLDNSDIDVNCYIDVNGDAGQFLSEFMGYHGMWYHQDNIDTEWPCLSGGHIHVGGQLSTRVAKDAAELTIETVIGYLDELMINVGDINTDYTINIQDVIILIGYILSGESPSPDTFTLADLNEDDSLNVQDIILLIEIILDL